MAEEKVDRKRSGQKSGGEWSDPENGSTGKAPSREETALDELVNLLVEVVRCVLVRIPEKDLPNAKLKDLAERSKGGKEVRADEYQSLAEVLTKACEAQDVVLEG